MMITLSCVDRLQGNFIFVYKVHELHVKLFFITPIPQWPRYGHNCKLTKKSTPENFLPYLNNQ